MPDERVLPTLRTEPDPHVAVAFSKSAALAANISNPGGVSASDNASFSSSEQVTALAGRTARVLARRDGLYVACRTYVDGIIGHDAHALILSQHGNLLVVLNETGSINQVKFKAQDAATTALFGSCISEYGPTRFRTSYVDSLLRSVLGSWRG